jgi:hypothetical protein
MTGANVAKEVQKPVVRSITVAASVLLASLVSLPGTVVAQERHERFERHEERREDHRFERRGWAFAPRFGWRYEISPGVWSPYYVWWWSGGRVVLRPVPAVTIVRYPTGYYELAGDGFNVPYHWVWVGAVPVAVPPAPPAVPGAVPGPPPVASIPAPPVASAPSGAVGSPPPPPPPAAPAADSAAPPPPTAAPPAPTPPAPTVPPPPVSAAPSSSAATSSAEVAQWYFCQSANGYYPNVQSCPEPWIKVPARAK